MALRSTVISIVIALAAVATSVASDNSLEGTASFRKLVEATAMELNPPPRRRVDDIDPDRVKAETRTKKIGIDWYTDDYFAEQPWEQTVPKTGYVEAGMPPAAGRPRPKAASGGRKVECDKAAYAALMEGEAERELAAKLACIKNIDAEKRRDFGPPALWQVWPSACKGACETWDAIHENARGKAKCTCDEVGTCDENTAFLLCKHIWICMSHFEVQWKYCHGCGTIYKGPTGLEYCAGMLSAPPARVLTMLATAIAIAFAHFGNE